MSQNSELPLRDWRETIHDLILIMHRTGLSPPEVQILEKLEAEEASSSEVRSSE